MTKSTAEDRSKARLFKSLTILPAQRRRNQSKTSRKTSETSRESRTSIKTLRVRKFSYEILTNNIKITHARAPRSNYIVAVNPKKDYKVSSDLPGPVYKFNKDYKWRLAGDILKKVVGRKYGVHFAGIGWNEIETMNPGLIDGETTVLHVFNNEPENRYRGRVGPVSLYVPHIDFVSCKIINGVWTSIFNDSNSRDVIGTATVFDTEYIRRLRESHTEMAQSLFYVTNDAALVGMQILHSHAEEKSFKSMTNNNFHHERPLILSGGYYLVDGIFSAKFFNPEKNRNLAKMLADNMRNKVILLCEGKHMIRVVTDYELAFVDARTSPIKSNSSSEDVWHDALSSPTWLKSIPKRDEPIVSSIIGKAFRTWIHNTRKNKKDKKERKEKKGKKRRRAAMPDLKDHVKIRNIEVQLDVSCTDIVIVDAKELLEDLKRLSS